MTLCDTGPLVAIVDDSDDDHSRCVAALESLPPGGLVTTWPCLTEAMYLLGREGGWPFQQALWSYFESGLVRIHPPASDELDRARTLMSKYADTPMDLADASIVAAAETLGQRRVFTVDSHFYAYSRRGHVFEVVP
ncbi:MAG TPA: PIN domain-containing protein [Longimicrobium sp.]|nr:PIN domain-containing protein [Longimicrobium sp.]